ncbi:hypothetical protein [Actinoplanes sp. NPDC049265]|uniref:hypothetical protein n=1 Tax=Actinoplanes sp. NPDC049265 TaxID=3363902 RepID=UPI003714387F
MTEPTAARHRAQPATPRVVMPPADARTASAALSQRREFVRAFVEHAAEVPASERHTVRWPTLITVTALVSVGAIVVGVFWTLIRPLKPGETRAGVPSGVVVPTGPVKTWTGTAGWDCAAAADRGFDVQGRTAQWRTLPSGAWRQDGCHGTFATLPLPSSKNDRASFTAVWWFTPAQGMRTCEFSVYVPAARPDVEAAERANYSVQSGGGGGTPYADFTVTHSGHAGRWVAGGSFPVQQGQIAVKLVIKGNEGGRGSVVVLGQTRVNCGD